MERQNLAIPQGVHVEHWNHKFQWTQEHLTNEECDKLRQAYDRLGDECFKKLKLIPDQQENSTTPLSTLKGTTGLASSRDLYSLLLHNQASDPDLQTLWTELNTVPSWVDWEQISRGQDVLYRYWGPMFIGLYSTLLEGIASPGVAETFAKNGGFAGAKAAKRRLYETAQFVLEMTKGVEELMPVDERRRWRRQRSNGKTISDEPKVEAGIAFRSCIRIRFLHAAVRQRLLAKEAPLKPGEKPQNPISHLHELGTISFFGPKLILLSLPRQYITYLSDQEQADWIALWRLVGFYLGTPTDPYFTSVHNAKITMESLLVHEIRPSRDSRKVARHVVEGLLSDGSALTVNSRGILIQGVRICLGRHLAAELGIEEYGDGTMSFVTSRLWTLFFRGLVTCQCLLFAAVCFLNRSCKSWDRERINAAKIWFWNIVIESKFGLKGDKWEYADRWVERTEKFSGKRELAAEKSSRGGPKVFMLFFIAGLILLFSSRK